MEGGAAEMLNGQVATSMMKLSPIVSESMYYLFSKNDVNLRVNLKENPTLLIIGQADRTVVGKDLLTAEQKNNYGQYPQLGKKIKKQMKNCKLIELNGVGHIPHVQEPDLFKKALFNFL